MNAFKNFKSFLLVICLFLSFALFYISYFYFINGVFNPAVRLVFLGSQISDRDIVYENSIIQSIRFLFFKKSYFNMSILLLFSIIIPILKLIMVSDNFYSIIKLYILKINNKETNDINLINIMNENNTLILKKFRILSSISRFQFVDVLISVFIVSSLNFYLIDAEMLHGGYQFLNYCILSTISSFFLLMFASIKIQLYKKENIKIYPLLPEKYLNSNRSNSMLCLTKMECCKKISKINNDSDIHDCIKNDKNGSNLKNKEEGEDLTNENIIEYSLLKNANGIHNGNNRINDKEEINSTLNEFNNTDRNFIEDEKNENQFLYYDKLQNLNSINYVYKLIKNNDAYIYLKKKKFNSLLKSNFSTNGFNILKLLYALFLCFYLNFCIYLIINERSKIFGIYTYLSYFNFNIDGILIDYNDMLNTLKIKIDKNYIYTFFMILPFIFPILICFFFFLSVLFLNIYYINFSNFYKKVSPMNNELVFDPEIGENQKVAVSEKYNYLYIKKEIEKNDRLSNTSDDLSSPNDSSTIPSSKSEDINTNFIYGRVLNIYFSLSVFFCSVYSFFLHFSLGEIITISILTFYQIVKRTKNLNIITLYKSNKVKFCKLWIFLIYGILCFSMYLYVRQWKKYLNKLRKTKKKILLFEKNRYSEIVDFNIQKNENCDIPIYSFFFKSIFKRKVYSKSLNKQKEHTNTMCLNNREFNEIDERYDNTVEDNEEHTDLDSIGNKRNLCNENKKELFISPLSDNNEILNSSQKKKYEESNLNNFKSKNLMYFKSIMPIKSILLLNLEKRRKKNKRDRLSKILILVHLLLFIFVLLLSLVAFIKKEDVLKFKIYSINKKLNNFFKSSKFHSLVPASIGKCKTKKYIAKSPCFNIGTVYHEQKTFYHATLFYLEDINSINIRNLNFYYDKGVYYLLIDGYFKHIYGPLFLKLCLGSNFCPIRTYTSLLGNMPNFSITLTAKCDDKHPPNYISKLFINNLKITKIEIVKDSGLIDNIDIKLDNVEKLIRNKINSMLAKKKKIIKWRNRKYHLEGFINYLITSNVLSSFSCEPLYN
ncbi:conserved Plasmodium membrane protein, unknown function [Plasmodium relictum]|uniref:Uncharacterized protein n=1 Tax=Plasmodium relictum TaxID=85471 RepID=A0A1J1H1R1_PLARL|nr:conserved Plasmodium membrane protein, unknown function [Plasmodium relictum]CRG98702.1 conserved Plasmodium membrane protein, unknown function [Plasmodium relictum]